MRTRPVRRFAPALVAVAACGSSSPSTPPPEPPHNTPADAAVARAAPPDAAPTVARIGGYTEFRDGRCEAVPDCTPPAGTNINPCNPPPPRQFVDCPDTLLPTPPPDLAVTKDHDGACWVTCDAAHCDADGPLRVKCLGAGALPPTYDTDLIVPKDTSYHGTGSDGDYTETRNPDMTCDMVTRGTKYTNVPCVDQLIPKVATGVVPVYSSTRSACYFGKYAVKCPSEPWHVWH